jgi:hypothetical protein
MKQEIVLIASGDLRLSANQTTWEAQAEAERAVRQALTGLGATVRRGHEFDPVEGHGFIKSQKHGMEVFRSIPRDAPLVVVEAVWQYSHHVLAGLLTHRGPILTVANWSGQWPGLVGLLNLNASLTKAGVKYNTLWSRDFSDEFFLDGLKKWLDGKQVHHDGSHVHALSSFTLPPKAEEIADSIAAGLLENKAILGVFDEGCMGMYNAIVPDELLHQTGIFKERLSQSSLYYATMQVSDSEAAAVRAWLDRSGMRFHTGADELADLTDGQILVQCKIYIAALRMAAEFGCDAIGIQYQQGLKDLLPASDLVEGLLNNADRPPVCDLETGEELFAGRPLPHFNEADECSGVDALVTNRIWSSLGFDPETTLHDIRYGESYPVNGKDEFVWVFEISGAVPPQHLLGGYGGALCERQPAAFFRLGGGTIKGICKPGPVVWSRIYIEDNRLKADLGRARAVSLPDAETERRWKMTSWQWPMMHAVLCGVTRDQMMGRHKSNHIQVAYAPTEDDANLALAAKAATLRNLGFEVSICGSDHEFEESNETRDQASLVLS